MLPLLFRCKSSKKNYNVKKITVIFHFFKNLKTPLACRRIHKTNNNLSITTLPYLIHFSAERRNTCSADRIRIELHPLRGPCRIPLPAGRSTAPQRNPNVSEAGPLSGPKTETGGLPKPMPPAIFRNLPPHAYFVRLYGSATMQFVTRRSPSESKRLLSEGWLMIPQSSHQSVEEPPPSRFSAACSPN